MVIPDFVITVSGDEQISFIREAHLNYTEFLFFIGNCEEIIEYDIDGRPKATIRAKFRYIGKKD